MQIDRTQIVDIIISAFKRSAATHKLGVLYCADSVVRQWIAQGGVNNAGVQKLTANIPSLMEELITTAPDAQKVCPRIRLGFVHY
jgi:protein NRD1